ncbi:MAG: hypothetical protein GXX09_10945 [Syntrophomonadaceae bacterium]|nr:hypothetical protein [Syntrophomonadaceae bacterium]
MRYQELMEDLKRLLAVEVRHDGKKYITRTRLEGSAYEAFKALGLRPPNHV